MSLLIKHEIVETAHLLEVWQTMPEKRYGQKLRGKTPSWIDNWTTTWMIANMRSNKHENLLQRRRIVVVLHISCILLNNDQIHQRHHKSNHGRLTMAITIDSMLLQETTEYSEQGHFTRQSHITYQQMLIKTKLIATKH